MGIKDDQYWMARALELASQAASKDEVPVGAVVVLNGKEIGAGFNARFPGVTRPPMRKSGPCGTPPPGWGTTGWPVPPCT